MTSPQIKAALLAAMAAASINLRAKPVVSINLSAVCNRHGQDYARGSIGAFRSDSLDEVSAAIALTQGAHEWAEGTITVQGGRGGKSGNLRIALITRARVGDFFAPSIVPV